MPLQPEGADKRHLPSGSGEPERSMEHSREGVSRASAAARQASGYSRRELRLLLLAGAAFAAMLLVIFGELLLGRTGKVPSHAMGDVAKGFVALRGFGFEELRLGNLPLWNPHSFAGTPFVGMSQSGMLYPLNAIYLVFPLTRAICLEFVLHLLLLALFVFAWLRSRGLHALAAFFSAVTVIFGASCFLRVHGGQMTVIDTLAWWPLLLLAVDRLAERSSPGWRLAGIAATSMMILAGHPPTVFMAGFATGLYCVPLLVGSRDRARLARSLAWLVVAPLFLSAAQLWTGLQVGAESIREGGMSFEFATSFSFPPENLLTLLVPEAFGNAHDFARSYFGRWFYWGASAYMGVVALMFAIHGAIEGRGTLRRVALVLVPLLTIVSLGRHSPLYTLLYDFVPGFAYVRAPSKFIFFATFFAAALAGIGLDHLLARRAGARQTAVVVFATALLLSIVGLWTWLSPDHAEAGSSPIALLASLNDSRSFDPVELGRWAAALQQSLVVSLGIALGAAGLLWLGGWRRWPIGLLALVGIAELFVFADANRGVSWPGIESLRKPALAKTYRTAGEFRVLEVDRASNVALYMRGYGLWGYDPLVLHRYAELMAFTQGVEVAELNNIAGHQPTGFHPLYAMLRGRFEVWKSGRVVEYPDPLPRFLLVRSYRVLKQPAAILAAMGDASFDPRRSVILEDEPSPRPMASGAGGEIRLLDESTDHLSLEVELAEPAILVMTDAYARGWRARALPGSSETDYRLQPGNYVLRAIALGAGRHRLRVEYSPTAFRVGRGVSILSGVLFLAAVVYWWRERRRGAGEAAAP